MPNAMRNKLTKITHILPILLIGAIGVQIMVSCSGDDGGGPSGSGGGAVAKAKIGGSSEKGPFGTGSTVTLRELNDDLGQTGKSFGGRMLDREGSFEIKNVELVSPYAELSVHGFYKNEVTGKQSTAQITLYAISDIREKDNVNINILTHLEYDRVLNLTGQGMSLKDAKKQAQKEILKVFYVNSEFGNSEDMSIFGTGESDAALLAISILLQGDLKEADFSVRLAEFSLAIKAGNADLTTEAVRTAMADWASEADLEGIKDNILRWGLSSKVPDFEKYIRNFVNTNYGLGECDRENKVKENGNGASKNKSMICKDGVWKVNAGNVESSSSNNAGTSSSSSSSDGGSSSSLEVAMVTVGGNSIVGSFVDLDPNPAKVYTQSQYLSYIKDIDIVYAPAFGGGDYIYSTDGAYWEGINVMFENAEPTFLYTLTASEAAAVKAATKYSDIESIAASVLYYGNEVDKIAAAEGAVFAVITSKENMRFVVINSKNGTSTIEIRIINIYDIPSPGNISPPVGGSPSSSSRPSSSSVRSSSSASNAEYCKWDGECYELENPNSQNAENPSLTNRQTCIEYSEGLFSNSACSGTPITGGDFNGEYCKWDGECYKLTNPNGVNSDNPRCTNRQNCLAFSEGLFNNSTCSGAPVNESFNGINCW